MEILIGAALLLITGAFIRAVTKTNDNKYNDSDKPTQNLLDESTHNDSSDEIKPLSPNTTPRKHASYAGPNGYNYLDFSALAEPEDYRYRTYYNESTDEVEMYDIEDIPVFDRK